MKQLGAFIKKEFYHILRDRRTLLILLGMPIFQIIIFGFALTNEVKNTRIIIFDEARDESSASVINEIEASRYFESWAYVNTYGEVEDAFKKGKVKLAVIFPAGFGKDLERFHTAQVQLIADASDPNTANTLTNYASSVLMDYRERITKGRQIPYSINTEIRMLYNPQLKGAYSFVPGVMAMVLMLVCTMMTAITIVREKETGTMEIMLASPMQPLMIIISKAIPYLLLSLVNIISILALSVWVLDVPINGSPVLLVLESILFIITCLSLGLLISTATDTVQTAMFISLVGLFLPTVMLSGFMFPIENMPTPLRVLAHLLPSKWYYDIVSTVMIKGVGWQFVWKETGILLITTLLLVALSLKKFKIRLA